MHITDEQGLSNNFATEPKVYLAEPPTKEEKVRYAFQALIAASFMGVVGLITYIAS